MMIRTQRSSFFFFLYLGGDESLRPAGRRFKKTGKKLGGLELEEEEEVLISTKITTEECLSSPACDGLPKTIGQRLSFRELLSEQFPPQPCPRIRERERENETAKVIPSSCCWPSLRCLYWDHETIRQSTAKTSCSLHFFISPVSALGAFIYYETPFFFLPSPSNFTMSDKR